MYGDSPSLACSRAASSPLWKGSFSFPSHVCKPSAEAQCFFNAVNSQTAASMACTTFSTFLSWMTLFFISGHYQFLANSQWRYLLHFSVRQEPFQLHLVLLQRHVLCAVPTQITLETLLRQSRSLERVPLPNLEQWLQLRWRPNELGQISMLLWVLGAWFKPVNQCGAAQSIQTIQK